MKKFKILLIDDTKEVLTFLKDNSIADITENGLSINIHVETLHVELEKNGNDYQIKEDTIKKLGILCQEKYDFIFSDFGFIGDRTVNETLRTTLLTNNLPVTKDDFKGNILQLKHILERFEELSKSSAIPEMMQGNINSNFLNHKGSVYVYTNSPKPFDNYFDSNNITSRKVEVKSVFPEADYIDLILMHNEFGITPQIESSIGNAEQRKLFYSLLLSKRINSLMQEAVLRYMVKSQDKLRIQNTKKAFQKLTAYGIGFGAFVALFGEVIFHFLHKLFDIIGHALGLEIDTNFWLTLFATIFVLGISWIAFPKAGISIAKKTEVEIDNLLKNKE